MFEDRTDLPFRMIGKSVAGEDFSSRANGEIIPQAVTEGADAPVPGRKTSSHGIKRGDLRTGNIFQIVIKQTDHQVSGIIRWKRQHTGMAVPHGTNRFMDAERKPAARKELKDFSVVKSRISGEGADHS